MAFVLVIHVSVVVHVQVHALLELLAITVVFSLLMVHSVFHVVHVQVHVLLEQFQRSNPHRTLLS